MSKYTEAIKIIYKVDDYISNWFGGYPYTDEEQEMLDSLELAIEALLIADSLKQANAKEAEIKIKPFGALCELAQFEINGIRADYEDFGNKCDCHPDIAEPHECGDTLVMDRDGNVFELLTLSVTEQDMNVEINLDDLLDDEFCSCSESKGNEK